MILCARRQAQLDEVSALAKVANSEGGTGKGGLISTLTLDMQDRDQIAGLLNRLPENMKKVDVLVNNAGMVFGTEKVGEIKQADIDTMFSTFNSSRPDSINRGLID